MANYIGRFAPSPTGPLHFGSLVACLASYLDAKANHGQWLLRIEDVDTTRCKPHYAEQILQTIRAFGFQFDGDLIYQSQRTTNYAAALKKIRTHTYACVCSRKEIADSTTHGIEGVVYPGICRAAQHLEHGNAIRLITNNEAIMFVDAICGLQTQQLQSEIGDFVIRRRDGLFAYQLAVVVDDAAQGVTHVVRGADLLDSTARQIYLSRLLGVATPQYLHIPVVLNDEGQKLSKQTLAAEIKPDEARGLLLDALRFLRQETKRAEASESLPDLLCAAAKTWQPNRMTELRNA